VHPASARLTTAVPRRSLKCNSVSWALVNAFAHDARRTVQDSCSNLRTIAEPTTPRCPATKTRFPERSNSAISVYLPVLNTLWPPGSGGRLPYAGDLAYKGKPVKEFPIQHFLKVRPATGFLRPAMRMSAATISETSSAKVVRCRQPSFARVSL